MNARKLLGQAMYTINEADLLAGVLEGGADGAKTIQQCMTEMATSEIPGNTVHPALWKRVTSIMNHGAGAH